MNDQSPPANNLLNLIDTTKVLNVKRSVLIGSTFETFCMDNSTMTDVSAKSVKITDANLSDIEIKFAQLGGAYIRDIGLPPEGHPAYDPGAKQRPLKFENCDLNGSVITNCDLSGVSVSECNLTGMTINGILAEDLLKSYRTR